MYIILMTVDLILDLYVCSENLDTRKHPFTLSHVLLIIYTILLLFLCRKYQQTLNIYHTLHVILFFGIGKSEVLNFALNKVEYTR